MKKVAVLVLAFSVVCCQQDVASKARKQDFHARKDACIKEVGADETDVKNALRQAVYDDADQTLKCFFKCMALKIGTMNEDGVINVQAVKQQIPSYMNKAEAEVAIEKCKDVDGPDLCARAFEFDKCYHQEMGPPPTRAPTAA